MMNTNATHTFSPSKPDAPELLFGTPLSIVVRARAEYVDGSQSSDIGLVIPRQHCIGNVPSQRALQVAARATLRRLNMGIGRAQGRHQAVRRLMICVNDQWQALICSQSPARAPMASKETAIGGHFRRSDKAPLSLVAAS